MDELNFEEKKFIIISTTDDPLWFEWFMFCGIFRYKIVRVILRLNILFGLIKYAVQIYYFKNNLTYFVRYGLLFFGEPLAIASEVVILWKRKDVEAHFADFPFWTLDSCGGNYKRQAQKEIKRYTVVVSAVLISVMVASFIVFSPTASDKNFLFPVLLIEEYWPEQAWFLSLAYKLTLVPMGYSSLVFPLVIMYGAQHMVYQSAMVGKHFQGILIGSENMDKDRLYCDKTFQDEVCKRISFCVKRQTEMIIFGLRAIKLAQDIFSVLFTFAYFVCVSIIMFYCSCTLGYFEYTLDNMLFPLNLCLNAVAMFVGAVIAGQQTEDSMEDVRIAVEEWNLWALDVRNQKTMLGILTGTKKFQLRFSQTLVLNYDFGVQAFKTIYSLTSLAATFKKFQ